jgi:hypothetical protein
VALDVSIKMNRKPPPGCIISWQFFGKNALHVFAFIKAGRTKFIGWQTTFRKPNEKIKNLLIATFSGSENEKIFRHEIEHFLK